MGFHPLPDTERKHKKMKLSAWWGICTEWLQKEDNL